MQKRYVFFDTETNGLPQSFNAPMSEVNNWPRIVSLSWKIMNRDGEEVCTNGVIVKPDGFVISARSTEVHGITTEMALEKGIDLEQALQLFFESIQDDDILIAHNFNFDYHVLGCEAHRLKNYEYARRLVSANKLCTMHTTTNFCCILGRYGYKWPTLTELHYTLFGSEFEAAHTSSGDVAALAKCFWELKNKHGFYQEV